MDFFDQRHYKICKSYAYHVGLWPYRSKSETTAINIIIFVIFIVQTIPKIIAMTVYSDDAEKLLDVFPLFAVDVIAASKYINLLYRMNMIKKILERIKSDWKTLLNEDEHNILLSYAEIGRMIAIGYAVVSFTATTTFILDPLTPKLYSFITKTNITTDDLEFVVPMEYYFFDKKNYYWTCTLITDIFILFVVTSNTAADILFILILQHACGLFAVVGHRLEHSDKSKINNDNPHYASITCKDPDVRHVITCIKSHSEAIQFAVLLESTYMWCFAFVILANFPMMSVTAYQLLLPDNTLEERIKYAAFSVTQLIHLLFDCYLSQQLMDQSSLIRERIMNGNWYDFSLEAKKLLIFMTMQTQYPCYLTAGKFIILSIETYAMLIKTTASYMTVLAST